VKVKDVAEGRALVHQVVAINKALDNPQVKAQLTAVIGQQGSGESDETYRMRGLVKISDMIEHEGSYNSLPQIVQSEGSLPSSFSRTRYCSPTSNRTYPGCHPSTSGEC